MANMLDEIILRARDAATADPGLAVLVKNNDDAAIQDLARLLTNAARSDMAYMIASAPSDDARAGIGFVYLVAALCQASSLLIHSTLCDEVVRLAKMRDVEDRISQRELIFNDVKIVAERASMRVQAQIDAILNLAELFGQKQDVIDQATYELNGEGITL